MPSKLPHYVIIGGGLSGLSTAYFLSLVKPVNSCRITLIENSNKWGGCIQSFQNPNTGAIYDLGPHSVRATSNNAKVLLRLATDLDLQDRLLSMRWDKNTANKYIYVNGTHIPISIFGLSTMKPFTRSPISLILRKLFTKPPQSRPDWTVDEFFRSRLDAEFADYYGTSITRGIFAGDSKNLSVNACFPGFVEMEKRGPNFILGLLRSSIFPNKDFALPKTIDNLLPNPDNLLPSKSFAWSFRTGMQTLTDALVQKLNSLSPHIQMHLNTSIEKLVPIENDQIELVLRTGSDHHSSDSTTVVTTHKINHSDALFVTCPSFASHEILKHLLLADTLNYLNMDHIPWNSILSISLEIANGPDPPVMGFGHLVPKSEDPHILGMIYDSMAFPQMDKLTNHNKRYTIMVKPYPHWIGQNLTGKSLDGEIELLVRRVLKTHLKFPNPHIVGHYIQMHPNAIAQYPLGHLDNVRKLREAIQLELGSNRSRLYLVGNSYDGVGLNDVVCSAMNAVSQELQL